MSFSRAKIHRFNEVASDVPSPTRYDPKEDKGKGVAISKLGRERSVSQSSDTTSGCGTPFRTPFSVKKHNCTGVHNDRLQVPRSMTFTEPGVTPFNADDESLKKAQLSTVTEALNASQRLTDELRAQNALLAEQKKELEARVTALETTKAELEGLVSINEKCETQVQELTKQLEELLLRIDNITSEKNELVGKLVKEEEMTNRLEDAKIEYETKILSLEGTLEQVKIEHQQKSNEFKKLKETGDKLKIANECFAGKVSSLETEITKLEAEIREKEETIFGLEDKASSLNTLLEAAHAENVAQQHILTEMADKLREQKEVCQLHDTTIKAMDLEIGEKQKVINQITAQAAERKEAYETELATLKSTMEQQVHEAIEEGAKIKENAENIIKEREATIELITAKITECEEYAKNTLAELNDRISEAQGRIDQLQKEKHVMLKKHEEDVFRLNEDWEKKMVTKVQEAEEAMLEKEAVVKLLDLQHTKKMQELRAELEGQLLHAEAEANRRQSAQLEAGELAKDKYEAKIADMETSIVHVLECKAKELAEANDRYKELLVEVTAQQALLDTKCGEISSLTACNHKLSTRVANMLEEIKLLNAENATCHENVAKMTDKFKDQLDKNDKLSEQLGELDCKVAAISEELSAKNTANEKLVSQLKKAQNECSALKVRNIDLQLNVASHETRANTLNADLEASRSEFKSQLLSLNEELANVKGQCYKFEIALANTRNSLNELGKRLMDSECEVVRLAKENENLTNTLAAAENEKNEYENKYRVLMEAKLDFEQRLKDSEKLEEELKDKIKQLELQNCDLELTKNELKIMHDTLQEDKKNYDKAMAGLQQVVNEQSLQMVKLEQSCLDQVEAANQLFIEKLDLFQNTSLEQMQKLVNKLELLATAKEEMQSKYHAKCNELESLLTDYDGVKSKSDATSKENEKLNHELREKQEEVAKTMETLKDITLQKVNILEELTELRTSTDSLKTEMSEKVQQIEELRKLVKDNCITIEDLTSQITLKDKQLDEMKTEISKVCEASEEKLASFEKAKIAEIEQLQSEYSAKLLSNTDEIVSLLSHLECEGKKIATLEEKNKEIAENCLKLEASVTELTNTIGDVNTINAELKEQLESISSELNIKTKREIAANEEITRLASELQQAKENSEWKTKWQSLLVDKEAMAAELLAMTEKKDNYKAHCQIFEKRANDAQVECAAALKDFDEIHSVLKEKDALVQELYKKVHDLESLIGPFKDQLELFEAERLMLENDRDLLRKQHLEQAANLGHQNHKQKIQHVVRLKNDILQLRSENTKLQVELKNKNKIIENMGIGEHPKRLFVNGTRPTSTPFKGKENDEPSHHRVKQEAMSPGNTLKQRNQ